jgi:hypothetical protein
LIPICDGVQVPASRATSGVNCDSGIGFVAIAKPALTHIIGQIKVISGTRLADLGNYQREKQKNQARCGTHDLFL